MSSSPIERQVSDFLSKFSDEIEGELRQSRARLRALFSHGYELVYDNYGALVFAISPTSASADALISVAGYPRWVTLFFRDGALLHDPTGLLKGQGKRFRSIRLESAASINSPEVEALILQAVMPFKPAFLDAPPLSILVKAVVTKQRSRRPV